MKVPSVQPTSSFLLLISQVVRREQRYPRKTGCFSTPLSFIFHFPVEIKPLFPKQLSQVGLILHDHHENSQM